MVVVNSRCVDLLDELELRTVLGHEAGHILSDHVLYITALHILIALSRGRPAAVHRRPAAAGGRCSRCSSGTARPSCPSDRAATLVNRDPLVTCRTMMVLAGGVRSSKLNLDAFIQPGERLRGVELRLGQAQPDAQRPLADARPPGPARQGDHGVGAVGRVRPDRRAASTRRATSRPTRARRPARPTSTTRSASAGSSASSAARTSARRSPTRRRRSPARPRRSRTGSSRAAATTGGVARGGGRPRTRHHHHGHARTRTRRRRTPTAAGWASRSG